MSRASPNFDKNSLKKSLLTPASDIVSSVSAQSSHPVSSMRFLSYPIPVRWPLGTFPLRLVLLVSLLVPLSPSTLQAAADEHSTASPCVSSTLQALLLSLNAPKTVDYLPSLTTALDLCSAHMSPDLRLKLLTHRAELRRQAGDMAGARDDLTTALALAQLPEQRETQAALLLLRSELDPDPNEPRQRRMDLEVAALKARDAGNFALAAEAQRTLGTLLVQAGTLEPALKAFEATLELAKKADNLRLQLATHTGLGRVWRELGEPETGRQHYRQALELAHTLLDPAREALTLQNLGVTAREEGSRQALLAPDARHAPAEGTCEALLKLPPQSIPPALSIPERWFFEAARCYQLADERYQTLGMDAGRVDILSLQAVLHRARGQNDLALVKHYDALTLAQSLKEQALEADMQASRGATLLELGRWEEAAEAYGHARAQHTAQDLRLLAFLDGLQQVRALTRLERFEQAQPLLEQVMQEGKALVLAVRDPVLQAGLFRHYARLAPLWLRIHALPQLQAGHPVAPDALSTVWQLAEEARSRSYLARWAAVPGLREVPPPAPVSLVQLQAALAPNTCLVAYLMDDDGSFAFVVTASSAQVVSLIGESSIAPKLQLFQTLIQTPASDMRRLMQEAHGLYQALVRPLEPFFPPEAALVLVKEGALANVPFEALLPQLPKGQTPQWLGLTHSLMTASSATTWWHSRANGAHTTALSPRAEQHEPLLVVAAPSLPAGCEDSSGLEQSAPLQCRPLPFVKQEIKAIRATRPRGSAAKDVYLTGDEATLSRLRALPLESFHRLHFSTHGLADDMRPLQSRLLLAEDAHAEVSSALAKDPHLTSALGTSAYLTAEEIARWQLTARLVTLSACETAVGRTRRGEGVDSLARAFLLAGARNVVATRWKVDDEATAHFYARLYRELARHSLEQALFRTRRAFAEGAAGRPFLGGFLGRPGSGPWTHPYFWAGFEWMGGG